jgi:predicted DNA-binding transcriptional regulator AlpA
MYDRDFLNSWKEVARYVGRSERTIQRWERDLGFPVHRPAGKLRSSVIALAAEIDEWIKATPTARSPAKQDEPTTNLG